MSVYHLNERKQGGFLSYVGNLFVGGTLNNVDNMDFNLEDRVDALYIRVLGDIRLKGNLGRLNARVFEYVPPRKNTVFLIEHEAVYDTGLGALLIELRRRGVKINKSDHKRAAERSFIKVPSINYRLFIPNSPKFLIKLTGNFNLSYKFGLGNVENVIYQSV